MLVSEKGLALIREFEGFVGHTYDDHDPKHLPVRVDRDGVKRRKDGKAVTGVLTIGYGETLPHVAKPGATITEPKARERLAMRVDADYASNVRKLVKVPLTQGQFDALASFVYNLGADNFSRSTLLKKLNRGDYAGAAEEFNRWIMWGGRPSAGLARRRAAEKAMFLGED